MVAVMVACPVCGRAGLNAFLRACPQCNADLECFQWLDLLHGKEDCHQKALVVQEVVDPPVAGDEVVDVCTTQRKPRVRLTFLLVVLFLLLGFMGGILVYHHRLFHGNVKQAHLDERARLADRVAYLERVLSGHQVPPVTLPKEELFLQEKEKKAQLKEGVSYVGPQLSFLPIQGISTSLSVLSPPDGTLRLRSTHRLMHALTPTTPLDER